MFTRKNRILIDGDGVYSLYVYYNPRGKKYRYSTSKLEDINLEPIGTLQGLDLQRFQLSKKVVGNYHEPQEALRAELERRFSGQFTRA